MSKQAAFALPKQLQPTPSSAKRILIVEDDTEIREAVQILLEEDGYPASVARNGQEALEWLHANGRPSLILLDLMMPVMDGRTFLARLKAMGPHWAVPVMVMSAQPRSLIPGVVCVMEKPFDVDDFLEAVHRHS